MPQRRFKTFRAVILATVSATTLILGLVSSVFASSGGPSFP